MQLNYAALLLLQDKIQDILKQLYIIESIQFVI